MKKPLVLKDPKEEIATIVIYSLTREKPTKDLISKVINMAKKEKEERREGPNKPNDE